jgi:hypothetical protein
MIVTVLALAGATVAVALVAPALGTEIQVGAAPGDVIGYGPSTGASGVSGATGTTGVTDTSPVPQCTTPATPTNPCLAISQTTGFQVKVGGTPSLTVIPRNGSIVAWTATLGDPSSVDIAFFDSHEGGAPEAGLAILKPGKRLDYTLEAQSPMVPLLTYLGQTAEFPLAQSLPVKKGEIVALTVPTWAPMRALYNAAGTRYGKFVSWRSSRQRAHDGCKTTSSQTAQQSLSSTVQYACLYQQVRVTYTALEVSTP